MIITYKVYKHSALATIVSILGSCLGVYGLAGTVVTLIDGTFHFGTLLVGLIGIALSVLAGVIGRRKTAKKLKKTMEDPRLVEMVRTSAEAAFRHYEKNEFIQVFQLIERYNPYAAARIYELKHGIKSRGQILQELRAYDNSGVEPVNVERGFMRMLESQYRAADRAKTDKLSKRVRTNGKVFKIAIILLPILIVGTIVASSFKVPRDPVKYEDADINDYTCVYVTSLEVSGYDDGYVRGSFETEDGETGRLRLTEEDAQDSDVQALLEGNAEEPVALYGSIRSEKTRATIGGASFETSSRVLEASVEPKKETHIGVTLLLMMACAAGLTAMIAGINYLLAKKELKIWENPWKFPAEPTY